MGPKVSVCIPTYNRAEYLGDAIGSVLEQTMEDFEIIVYDDASTDATVAVVEGFADPRIRYFRQPVRVGISGNRNACLAVARGQYIGWLDSDDRYLPSMLDRQCRVLDAHPEVGLVHGEAVWIDAAGTPVTMPAPKFPPTTDTIEPGLAAFRELCASNYIVVPTVLVRRACYETVGTYNPALQVAEDSEMWLRIALRYDLAFRTGAIAVKRVHPTNAGRSLDMARLVANRVRSIQGIFAHAPRRHAGVRALHHLAVAGSTAQALWQIHAQFRRDQSRLLLGRLARQAVAANHLLPLSPAYWDMIRAILLRDGERFDRAWRELIQAPLLSMRDTRQGRSILDQHFASLEPSSRILLRRAAERHYNPSAEEQVLEKLQHDIEQRFPHCRSLLVAGAHGLTVLHPSGRGVAGDSWDGYFPTQGEEFSSWLEQLRDSGTDAVALPHGASWANDYVSLTVHMTESGTPGHQVGNWMLYDLHAYTDRVSLIRQVRASVISATPENARILVVARGDDDLLDLEGRLGGHFPQDDEGRFAGWYPATSEEAVSLLEGARSRGWQYLVFPRHSMWWLRHYSGLADHLRRYAEVLQNDACLIVQVSSPAQIGETV
jgi:hypothetical protein